MLTRFLITDESHTIEPSELDPFVVVTREGQPVSLVARMPFAGEPPRAGAKTAAILVVPDNEPDPDLEGEHLTASARAALLGSKDSEGVIVINEIGRVLGVIPADALLDTMDIIFEPRSPGFEPLPGPQPEVPASVVYSCPVPECTSPDVVLWQKGRSVPPCPYHRVPRSQKTSEADR